MLGVSCGAPAHQRPFFAEMGVEGGDLQDVRGIALALFAFQSLPTNYAGVALLLVGVVKGPAYYNPRGHPERARERRNLVLGVMADLGLISADEAMRAKSRKLGVSRQRRTAINTFPAFLDLVRRQLRRDYREDDLTTERLRIFTGPEHTHQAQQPEPLNIKTREARTEEN